MADLADYLDLSPEAARVQFGRLLTRRLPSTGQRQVDFAPVETLLCLAASFMVNHRRFGSGSAPRAPEPVPSLARLFARPPSSVLAKMANLDGSRSHGGRWDVLAGATLREHPEEFSRVYRLLLAPARAKGIGPDRLPDFLGLEAGGSLVLLGQDELELSLLEADLHQRLEHSQQRPGDLSERETERVLVAATRVGQHVFASQVLRHCATAGTVVCSAGFAPPSFQAPRMLVASHIKPWRDSDDRERLDHRNGPAACPTHDVAFDVGLLTVNGGLRIHTASRLSAAVETDQLARQYFDRPPLREVLLLPEDSDPPAVEYLRWHKDRIFAA